MEYDVVTTETECYVKLREFAKFNVQFTVVQFKFIRMFLRDRIWIESGVEWNGL